ncbi:KEOPS complex subunit Pcc1 [Methanobrevibacter filiformis]|uniref:Transcription factor Pcc1 n=1 Tax=Methanobrevibacter filiformis TaxID=55758 RepID=A0A166AZN5_9EURY|nr:KEOPS complex subunit Pcc1 [Methanobrevibacter filiformis]KZX12676.1 transcription factor Pcc1 [Methanobrevibacter filiformis]
MILTDDKTQIVNNVNSTISLEFDSLEESQLVYKSVINEVKTSPDYRSKLNLAIKDNFIHITIDSQDMTSFRASINSIIKWIKLSLEIINLTKF